MFCGVGTEIELSECVVKTGTGKQNGKPWMLVCPVNQKTKKREYALFVDNPLEAAKFTGKVFVKKIRTVKTDTHNYNGEWYTDITISAELGGENVNRKAEEAVNREFARLIEDATTAQNPADDFMPADLASDEGLPFA